MPDDAEITMMLYSELLPEEESILKAMEQPLMNALLAHSVTVRPVWTSETTPDGRVVQLLIRGDSEPRILIELPADHISTVSADDMVSRLERKIEEI